MKCTGCHSEEGFRTREIHRLGRSYYICRKCGKANRPIIWEEANPTGWAKKALAIATEVRGKFLQSLTGYKFRILIWGPSEQNMSKADIYQKRQQIRDTLREKDQDAFFSEEIPPIPDALGNPLPINVAELFQTEAFDLVINLADSSGSLIEAEKFTEGLLLRCLIWLRRGSRGFQSGLATQLANIGQPPIYFDDDDIKSCIITLASEDWVHAMRTQEVNWDILEERINQYRLRKKRWTQ